MGHEHHHKLTQLDRIEKSVGHIEGSAGASQAGLEEALARLDRMEKTMARTAQEWTEALDGLQTAVVDTVTSESEQIKTEIQRLKDLAGPDLGPQFDRVIQMQTDFKEKISRVWEAEAPSAEGGGGGTEPPELASRRR